MKKSLKNKLRIFIVIICFLFASSVFAQNAQIPVSTSYDDMVKAINQEQMSSVNNRSETPAHAAVNGVLTPEQINKINAEANAPKTEVQKATDDYVKNKKSSKRHVFNLFLKFLLSMVWVGISSVIIFIILLSYKKFILHGKRITPTYESKAHSLDTPTNFKEAIKLFLDKTKWN